MMEYWDHWSSIWLKNNTGSWDKQTMDRKNIKRGFKKLRVWQDAVSLYVLACKIFADFPFELKKVAGNSIEADVGCFFGNWNQLQRLFVKAGKDTTIAAA